MDQETATPAAPADDFVVTSSGPVEPVAVEPVADSVADVEPVEDASPSEPAAADRNPDGTFKPKKRDNPIERMKAATAKEAEAKREREAAQRERDDAKAEAARYRQELEALKAPKPPAVRDEPTPAARVAGDPEPDPTDAKKYPNGEYDRQFIKDQARWEAKQEFQAQEQARAEQQRAQQQQQFRTRVEREFQQRVAEIKKTVPNFDDLQIASLNQDHLPFIKTQKDGPAILVYLANHPDDAQRLAALPWGVAAPEYGRISARLESAASSGSASRPSVSQATTPITPLGGGPSALGDEGGDDESFEAFFKRENAHVRTRAR